MKCNTKPLTLVLILCTMIFPVTGTQATIATNTLTSIKPQKSNLGVDQSQVSLTPEWSQVVSITKSLDLALGQINDDQYLEIISVESDQLVAISGINGSILWTYDSPGLYRSGATIGNFDPNDDNMEIATQSYNSTDDITYLSLLRGETDATRIMNYLQISGLSRSGPVITQTAAGQTRETAFHYGRSDQFSSYSYTRNSISQYIGTYAGLSNRPRTQPVIYDVTGDGYHEHILQLDNFFTAYDDSTGEYVVNRTLDKIYNIQPVVSDFDNDGYPEVVTGNYNGDIVGLTIAGYTDFKTKLSDIGNMVNYEFSPAVGDLTGDGIKEIIIPSTLSNNLFILSGNTGELLHSVHFGSPPLPTTTVADINGDRYLDVVYALSNGSIQAISGKDFSIIMNYEDPNLTEIIVPPSIDDIDDDNKLEIVFGGLVSSEEKLIALEFPDAERIYWQTNTGSTDYRRHKSTFTYDKDGDGMEDILEEKIGSDPSSKDTDNDGLEDHFEYVSNLSSVLLADTDGDGLTDAEEINGDYQTNAWEVDTDGDGLIDGKELEIGTSPLDPDTDNDSMDDGWELAHGLDPRNGADANVDTDLDGLLNIDEYKYQTNPMDYDTDDDGLSDGYEIENGLDPLVANTNNSTDNTTTTETTEKTTTETTQDPVSSTTNSEASGTTSNSTTEGGFFSEVPFSILSGLVGFTILLLTYRHRISTKIYD